MLFKHEAPEEVLITFLSCIADAQISATLAHKVQCYKFVIDLHLSQKDRASLAEYKQILPTNSQYRTYADQILNTPVSTYFVVKVFSHLCLAFVMSHSFYQNVKFNETVRWLNTFTHIQFECFVYIAIKHKCLLILGCTLEKLTRY